MSSLAVGLIIALIICIFLLRCVWALSSQLRDLEKEHFSLHEDIHGATFSCLKGKLSKMADLVSEVSHLRLDYDKYVLDIIKERYADKIELVRDTDFSEFDDFRLYRKGELQVRFYCNSNYYKRNMPLSEVLHRAKDILKVKEKCCPKKKKAKK